MISLSYSNAQITLDFKNPTIVNGGIDLAVGTQYRFQNVGTALDGFAIDALVTIQTKSANATLLQFDDNTEPFTVGRSDFRPIVQNSLNTPAGDVDGDYVTFFFEFVRNIDNSTPVYFETKATSYDIDGNNNGLREYVQISNFNSYIVNNPTELNYFSPGRYESSTDFNNPGIDGDAEFMAETSYSLISTFSYRAGVLRDANADVLGRLFALTFESLPFNNPVETVFIDAVVDDFSTTPIDGDLGGTTASVFANNGSGIDTLDGNQANASNVSVSILDPNGLDNVTINSDGTINIPVNSVPGVYNVIYQICSTANVPICDSAVATIEIFGFQSVCDEIIPLGNPTTQVPHNDITWNLTGTGPSGSIILNSIGIVGEPNDFSDLIVPDNVNVSIQNVNISKKVIRNGIELITGTSGLPAMLPFIMAEASDTDLNHYLKFDNASGNTGTVQGDYVDYLYDDPIIAARNRYVIATERGGNNTSSTQMLDVNGNPIGVKALNTPGFNYFPTGAHHDNGQRVMATVFPTTAFVARGTHIYGIRYMQEDNGDGADGQAFIMRDPVTIGCFITAEDDDFTSNPISSGGTTPSVFLDNGNGVDDSHGNPANNANIDDNISITDDTALPGTTINPDGTINIPSNAAPGTYTVEYQICLEIDHTKCDTATATFIVDNQAPIAVNDNATTPINTPVIVPVLDNDFDPTGDAIVVVNINGTLVTPGDGTQVSVAGGTVELLADGTVQVTPTTDSTAPITFTYTIDDGNGGQDTGIVNVTVFSIPDFGPTIFTGNTNIIGTTGVIDFRVLIGEFAQGNSNAITNVELRIVKNAELIINFDNTLTSLNGQPVQNNQWQYDGSHPSLHKFIYIGNGGIFVGNSGQFIGINAIYNPPNNTVGTFPLKTTVKYFSGGETNNNNNNDIDYIEYINN